MLENELKLTCKEFEEDDIKALLKKSNKECTPRETIQGYPSYPLYREIGNMLQQWMEKRYIHYIVYHTMLLLMSCIRCPIRSMDIYALASYGATHSKFYPCDRKCLYVRE